MLEDLDGTGLPAIEADAFAAAFGESLEATLDLGTWRAGEDLAALYSRLAAEVAAAVEQESRVRTPFRATVFPRLADREGAPPGAGKYSVTVEELERVHHGLLFNG